MADDTVCIGNGTDTFIVENVLVIICTFLASGNHAASLWRNPNGQNTDYHEPGGDRYNRHLEVMQQHKHSWLAHTTGPSIWSWVPDYPYTGELAVYSMDALRKLHLRERGTLKELANVDFLKYKDDLIVGEKKNLWDEVKDVYSGPQLYNKVYAKGSQSRYACRQDLKMSKNTRSAIRTHARDVIHLFYPSVVLQIGDQPRTLYMRFHPRGKGVATNWAKLRDKSNKHDVVIVVEVAFLRGRRIQRGRELMDVGAELMRVILKSEVYSRLVGNPSVCVIDAQYKFLDVRIHIDVPGTELHKLDWMLEHPTVF